MRDDTAEQRQRQPIRHVHDHQEHAGEEGVEHGENGTGEQEGRNLILGDRPHGEDATLGGRREPLANGTTQLGARRGNIVGDHQNGGDVDERRGNTGNGVHGLTGEVGHPRGLDVLQDLRPKIVDLRQIEGETLIDESSRLLIHIGKPRNQCDHLLDEHVAEQQQQYAYGDDHHGERQQRRDHAVPTVNHQALHHRFDRKREEQRNEDVVDQVRDRSP